MIPVPSRRVFTTGRKWEAIVGYARAVRIGPSIEISGCAPTAEDGSMVGTIGGGCVEAEVWNAAREVMETEKPKHMSFNLGQDAAYDNGLICGGQLDVFVEPVIPPPRAVIFGVSPYCLA